MNCMIVKRNIFGTKTKLSKQDNALFNKLYIFGMQCINNTTSSKMVSNFEFFFKSSQIMSRLFTAQTDTILQ